VWCERVRRTVIYLPDNELAAAEGECGGRRALLEAIAGADVLIHDATYLPAELPAHRGWGHSTYAEAVRLAADAGVPRLVLFHHAPTRETPRSTRSPACAQALARRRAGAARGQRAARRGRRCGRDARTGPRRGRGARPAPQTRPASTETGPAHA
jgi:sugar phosphate isomerase/epimerase